MTKSLKYVKNEKCTLKDLEYMEVNLEHTYIVRGEELRKGSSCKQRQDR